MLKLGSVVLNVSNVDDTARFWSEALNLEVRRRTDDWALAEPRTGGGPKLAFDLRDRTHLDLYTSDANDQAAEVKRLTGLGARGVTDWPYPPDADYTVLADPSGNLFCVVAGGA